MTEADIERGIIRRYREAGWVSMHVHPDGRAIPKGWPDVLCLGPGGRCVLIEVKKPGEEPTPIQQLQINTLRSLGFTVLVADTVEDGIGPLE